MNLRFLETFVWLAKLRNFRLTAEKLHTTQAAVSSRIATLEQELGVRLFGRGDREVTLTLEGSKALVYADRLVRTTHEMLECMKDRSLYTGVVRIGVIESIIHSWFPELMTRIHSVYPQLEVELAGDTTIRLIDQFSKGNLDLILQTDPVLGADVQNMALCDFPMRWFGAPHLNLHGEALTLADIAAFPILSFSRNSGPHRFLERLFDDRVGRQVHINCMTSVSAMIRLVVDGFGLAMIPPAIIQRELADGDVRLLQIDTEMPNMVLVCSYRSGPETPLFQQIATVAQQTAQDFARGLPGDVARMPAAELAADPWTLSPSATHKEI
ncbi:LysR family transcriptional regulator [Ramlibacter sp. RBP-2]|uniref:LysR family transcriptional regulator n=1 Tax=Ramlibacter lithotrophicus TaxID=2606681 RepID=A0A7X6DF07_9BURK|nr:LysR family transcriptional regulator [Ramlibacter lithotrophicus]NKE65974.1 LysR family transcriptional regulator [Ramlibacter lithotrophicus]